MKIAICGSIDITSKIKEVSDKLIKLGHMTEIPFTSQRIINGELILKEFKNKKKNNGDGSFRKTKNDLIKRYYNLINESDSILVLNVDKNNIKNYIGGNTFLEYGLCSCFKQENIFV